MEQSKWLHIDFAKEVYYAMNHKDIYYQMMTWLQRCKNIIIIN